MTDEQQREFEKQAMLHFAAKIQQLRHELYEWGKNVHKGSWHASHELGTAAAYLDVAANKITRVAGK